MGRESDVVMMRMGLGRWSRLLFAVALVTMAAAYAGVSAAEGVVPGDPMVLGEAAESLDSVSHVPVDMPIEVCDGKYCAGFIPAKENVQTRSAYGCNGDVCISLTGSGLTVDKWRTTAWRSSSDPTICNATAYFKAKHPSQGFYTTVDLVTVPGCYYISGYFYAYFEGGGSSTWVNGTRLGNSWDPNAYLTGFPTKEVHD
jgi:hypothetical protein